MEVAIDQVVGGEVDRAILTAPIPLLEGDILHRQIEIVRRPGVTFQAGVNQIKAFQRNGWQRREAAPELF
ncbi:hypothetical protein D3C80_1971520 [compost metagenome]